MAKKQRIVKDGIVKETDFDFYLTKSSLHMSDDKRRMYIHQMNKGWARSYAQKSQANLRKMSKKIKDGIKKEFFSGHSALPHKPARGWTGGKGALSTDQYDRNKIEVLKIAEKRKGKGAERLRKGIEKYLDASEYELRYGVNSKKSQDWRVKHGKDKKYTGRIKNKKTGEIKYYQDGE